MGLDWKSDIICIQETEIDTMSMVCFCKKHWCSPFVEREALWAIGITGGVLMMWDTNYRGNSVVFRVSSRLFLFRCVGNNFYWMLARVWSEWWLGEKKSMGWIESCSWFLGVLLGAWLMKEEGEAYPFLNCWRGRIEVEVGKTSTAWGN